MRSAWGRVMRARWREDKKGEDRETYLVMSPSMPAPESRHHYLLAIGLHTRRSTNGGEGTVREIKRGRVREMERDVPAAHLLISMPEREAHPSPLLHAGEGGMPVSSLPLCQRGRCSHVVRETEEGMAGDGGACLLLTRTCRG
jgi:hypothetical protein